jgi:hypothetical protein
LLVRASPLLPVNAFSSELFPTFDRPANATSILSHFGQSPIANAELTNLASSRII